MGPRDRTRPRPARGSHQRAAPSETSHLPSSRRATAVNTTLRPARLESNDELSGDAAGAACGVLGSGGLAWGWMWVAAWLSSRLAGAAGWDRTTSDSASAASSATRDCPVWSAPVGSGGHRRGGRSVGAPGAARVGSAVPDLTGRTPPVWVVSASVSASVSGRCLPVMPATAGAADGGRPAAGRRGRGAGRVRGRPGTHRRRHGPRRCRRPGRRTAAPDRPARAAAAAANGRTADGVWDPHRAPRTPPWPIGTPPGAGAGRSP